MKYSSEFIRSLSFREYLELMAKELNEHGFTERGNKYNVFDPPYMKLFMMGPVNDPKAMSFLKEIGLIENGRCPECGAPMSTYRWYWSDRRDPSKKFYVCYGCSQSNGHGDGHSMDGTSAGIPSTGSENSGCMAGLIFLPITLFQSLIS